MIDVHGATVTYGDETLEVVGGTVSLNRTRVPFASGSVTVKGGYDIDPRLDERVRVSMRQDFARGDTLTEIDAFLGGADLDTIDATIWDGMTLDEIDASLAVTYDLQAYQQGTFRATNLGVRSTSYDATRNETTVQFASDEAFAQDYASLAMYQLGFGTDLRTTVGQALRYIGATLQPGTLTYTLEEAPVWEPGESLWSFLNPLVTAAGLLLYSDETRAWWLINPDTHKPGQITLSGADSIVGAVSIVDRESDEWADGVLVVYNSVNSLGASISRYDSAGVPRPSKVITVTYERTVFPGAGAAAAILNRISRRGRQVPVDAVNNYDSLPSTAVSIAVNRFGEVQQGFIKSVEWGMLDGNWRMRLEAYDLEAVLADAMDAFPPYVMMTGLLGMMNTLNPGDY